MAYTITLTLSGIAHDEVPAAELTAREILERRLGGPLGVEAAYRAAHAVAGPDPRLPAPAGCSLEERAAVDRWQRAVAAVWAQLHARFDGLPVDEHDERTAEAALWIEVEGVELAPY